jgi:hypothetical protein
MGTILLRKNAYTPSPLLSQYIIVTILNKTEKTAQPPIPYIRNNAK